MAQVQPFNYQRSRLVWDTQVRRWGGQALLRVLDGSGDIPCWALIVEYKPMERLGKGYDPTDQRAMISPFVRDLTLPRSSTSQLLPAVDSDLHGLTMLVPDVTPPQVLQHFRFYTPTGKIAPGETTVLYDMRVRAGTR